MKKTTYPRVIREGRLYSGGPLLRLVQACSLSEPITEERFFDTLGNPSWRPSEENLPLILNTDVPEGITELQNFLVERSTVWEGRDQYDDLNFYKKEQRRSAEFPYRWCWVLKRVEPTLSMKLQLHDYLESSK